MSRVRVFFEQRLVGMVDVDKNGPGFTYDRDWISLKGAFPVSTTMPLTAKRVGPDTFFPWAANLLPENEQLRTLGQLLGMAREDVIGLLSAIGGDTAGALSIGQPGRTGSVQWRPIAKPEDLESIIEELPNKPFLVGDDGVSMSLAGAQTKLAVALDEAGRVCIPMNGSPSTHILKPDTQRLFGGVQNEAFCLTLTRRVGIPTPTVSTGRAGKRTAGRSGFCANTDDGSTLAGQMPLSPRRKERPRRRLNQLDRSCFNNRRVRHCRFRVHVRA